MGAAPIFYDQPLHIVRAEGCWMWDADGRRYLDAYNNVPHLGHCHPEVVAAVSAALERGMSFGAPTEMETQLAQMVIDAVPAVDMVRMVNSGTEATMSAVRLARGYTGRDRIVKFDGCYHGHADSLLVAAGSGVATLAIPGSPGIPEAFAAHTLSLPYNDADTFRQVMKGQGDGIAAVIVEPVAGNMGLVPPLPGFLETLREETTRCGSLLILDEVMTGFRVAYGGAQTLYNIRPDLATFGKIIGGGLPVGAYGGRRDIMARMAPGGPVYQAGTLSGNPMAMAAGIATLTQLQAPGFYENLDRTAEGLARGLKREADKAGIPVSVARVGSMLGLFFTDRPVHSFADAKNSDLERFTRYYRGMLAAGIYLAPSQFEALFVSAAHTEADIEATLAAVGRVMPTLGA
jgi:glutamate-1-semialdehyde 2,1-aminomutase